MAYSKWRVCGMLLAAFAAGCGGGGESVGSGGGAGDGGTATMGGSGGTTASTSTSVASTSSAGGAGTGGSNPDCPEGSLYALSDTALDENVVSMCDFKGDVLLIVNVAEA